jgi:Rod binding domain-containing protein
VRIRPEAQTAALDAHRIDHASRQFESLLLQQMLAPLAQDENFGAEDGAAGQVRETAVQALAAAMSEGKGIGLAHSVAEQLHRKSQTGVAAGSMKVSHESEPIIGRRSREN